jgi:hypothetical protein
VGKNYLETFDYQLIKALDSRRRRRRRRRRMSVGTIGFFSRRQFVLKGVFCIASYFGTHKKTAEEILVTERKEERKKE